MIHTKDFFANASSRAIGLVFSSSGIVFGTWATFVPYLKEKFFLNEAQLGLLLLSMPVGIFLVNPMAVLLIKTWGAAKTAVLFAAMTGLLFLIPIAGTTLPLVATGLLLAGASFGITNISMNTCASLYEESTGKRLMASCHGMWSLGAMIGAFISGFSLVPLQKCCAEFSDPQIIYTAFQAVLVGILVFFISPHILGVIDAHMAEVKKDEKQLKFILPGKELWLIISICLCTYLTEGTIADWSSVYLKEVIGMTSTLAGSGFAIYSLFMATGRFFGDDLLARFESMEILRAGGFLVIAGMVIIVLSPAYALSLSGFVLTGIGISLASPILYQASAKVKGMAPGVGLATMNTFAMMAFLGGPVLIGFVAQIFSLRVAFLLIIAAAILWIIQAGRVLRLKRS